MNLRDHLADGRLAGGGHMALADDLHKFCGTDLVKFPVALSGNGNGQGRDRKTGLPGLGRGIKSGRVGNDANHKLSSSDKFFDI